MEALPPADVDMVEGPTQLAIKDAAAEVLACRSVQTQQVASTFAATTLGVQHGSRMAIDLLGKAKAVSNWSKATLALVPEDKKAPLQALVKYLETLEIENVGAVQRVSNVAHLCGELMAVMASIFAKVQKNFVIPESPGAQSGIKLDMWNSGLIERELKHVELLHKEIGKSYSELQTFVAHDATISLATIQAVERAIFATDTLQQAERQIAAIQARKRQRQHVMKERAVEESEVDIKKAVLEDVKVKLESARNWGKQLESRKSDVDDHRGRLVRAATATKEQALAELKELQATTQEQLRALVEEQSRTLKQHHSRLDEVTALHEQKLRDLELELGNVEGVVGNHTVFCVDRSGSMSGTRWPAALAAIESFRDVRVRQGSMDRVSVVAFNHQAALLAAGPMTSDFVATLRRHGPAGGTQYRPAWEEVGRCAAAGPEGFKLIVVFVTDGAANDVPEAAQVARRLFEDFATRGGMQTFVVNIDNMVDDRVLEPLVKAGNGGQNFLRVFGERTELLVNVKTHRMVQEFQRLAECSSARELTLKRRVGLLQHRGQEHHAQHCRSIAELQKGYTQRAEQLRSSLREAERASEDDAKQVERVIKQQIEQLNDEWNELCTKIENNESRIKHLEGEMGKAQRQLECQVQFLKDTAETHQKELDALLQTIETEVQGLEGVQVSQDVLQQAAGTTDLMTLLKRIDELHDLKRLCTANLFHSGDQAQMVGSLNRFLAALTDHVREPLGGCTLEHASKANFVFEALLKERGMAPTAYSSAASSEGLQAVLAHEARSLGVEDADVKEVLRTIMSAGLTPEDFCGSCSSAKLSKEEVDREKTKLAGMVEQRAFQSRGLGEDCRLARDVKALKSKRTKKTDELEDLQKKAESAPDDSKLADKLESKQEEVEQLEDQIAEKQSELKAARADVARDVEVPLQLVRQLVDQCVKAYSKQMAGFELQQLVDNFRSYHQNIHQPMQNLVQTVSSLKRAYSTPLASTAALDLCSMSVGLQASLAA